jgi:heterodisulfide reductase subunit A
MSGTRVIAICECFGTCGLAQQRKALIDGLAERAPGARVAFFQALCQTKDMGRLTELLDKSGATTCAVGACSIFAKGQAVLDALGQRRPNVATGLADLREGCAWIHAQDSEQATRKALDLIAMALAAATGRGRSPKTTAPAERRALVIGAGPAGMAAAGTLAGLGTPVTLIDRLDKPGGLLRQIGKLFPDNAPSETFLAPLEAELGNPLVEFLPKTTVAGLRGDPGDFRVTLQSGGQPRELRVGAVILACGAMPVLPDGRYRSKELRGVISQLELETRLKKAEADPSGWSLDNAVFIQCMAARDAERPYCSAICCPTALKNAIRLKALRPETSVTILQRGIMTPGAALEVLYRQALAAGVRVVGFAAERPPEIQGDGQASGVRVADAFSGEPYELPADLVVLSTPLKPQPALEGLARMLGLRLDNLGFACGREPVAPVSASVPGIFVCGTARWPVYAAQAADQGRAAGIKAAAFLAAGELNPSQLGLPGAWPGTSAIRAEACSRCGQCVAVCPYGACQRGEDGSIAVSAVRCRGCGACAGVCPSGAASIPESNALALRAMLREAATSYLPGLTGVAP